MTQPQEELPFIGIPEAREMLLQARTIIITSHVNPDGDALGSEGAMYHYLKEAGKNVRIINTHPVPKFLELLTGNTPFEEYLPEQHDDAIRTADAILVLDVNAASRLLRMEEAVLASPAQKLVIDHHTSPKPFAHGYCVDTEASATGELVYDLIAGQEDVPFTYDIALSLYVAIITDTGGFQFDRTTPQVHRIAAHLLELGVQPAEVLERVYNSFSFERTKLLGTVLAGMDAFCDGRATILLLTQQMLKDTGTVYEETEGFVNYGLSVDGVRVTAMVSEMPDCVKVSFRARNGVYVNQVAASFGGGGHVYASAARITRKSYDTVYAEVRDAFQTLLANM